MSRFIKYNPDSDMAKFLQSKPIANHLANIIAVRARRTKCPFKKLEIGECFIGDYKKIGITEQQYRTAKKCLKAIGLATFKGTNKGTVAKLVSIEVWNLNVEATNERVDTNLTKQERLTKNVKNKELKNNIVDFKKLVAFFIEHTGKTMRIKKDEESILKQPNYKLVNARLKDGVTMEEMEAIIKMKHSDWKDDTKSKKFIRFETLFGPDNVQKYLNELDNKGTSANSDSSQPTDLNAYLTPFYHPGEIRRMNENGKMEEYQKLLDKETFRLNNIAKSIKNPTFSIPFLFEALYLPLGKRLGGSNPERKLESLQRWTKTINDYNLNKGDFRKLLQERNKKLAL